MFHLFVFRYRYSHCLYINVAFITHTHTQIHHLHVKYCRAESHRKSLVYQKRYLILLIGGFQDGEKDTLATIAHMGAFPTVPASNQRRRRAIGRFRAVAMVVVVISRMKYLVAKWSHAARRNNPERSGRGGVVGLRNGTCKLIILKYVLYVRFKNQS